MKDEVLKLLIEKISELTEKDAALLSESTDLKTEVVLKSIEIAAITAMLEEEYDAYVKYTALMHAQTIGEMADAVIREIEG